MLPSGSDQPPVNPPNNGNADHSCQVQLSLEASKALNDTQLDQLISRVLGSSHPPGPLAQKFLAHKLSNATLAFLSHAYPHLDPEQALELGLRQLCPDSHQHSRRVGHLAARFLRELGLDPQESRRVARFKEGGLLALTLASLDPEEQEELLETLEVGGELHDIGKLAIPERILNKRGPLNDQEAAIVRLHPVVGEALLDPLSAPPSILSAVRGHHERWDGRGYPDGLEGDDIPFTARVISLVDSFDAMTEHRPYRGQVTPEVAATEILSQAGRQFDPELAQLFASLIL